MYKLLISLLICISFLHIIRCAGPGYNQLNDFRTGRILTQSSGFLSLSTPVTLNATYTSALSGTTYAGLGIVGFSTLLTNDFNLNATISAYTTTNIVATTYCTGDTVTKFFDLNYIVVGVAGAQFFQIVGECFLCQVIRYANGNRSEDRTLSSKYRSGSYLKFNSYLSGFLIHNSLGINNYLGSNPVLASSSTIKTTFTVTENNTALAICYFLIIFDSSYIYNNNNKIMAVTGVYDFSYPVSGTYPISPNGRYTANNITNTMFFGMSSFNLSRAYERSFYSSTANPKNLPNGYNSNTTNFGTYLVRLTYLYVVERDCPANEFYDFAADNCDTNCSNSSAPIKTSPGQFCAVCNYTCLTCSSGLLYQCSTCQSNNHRTLNTVNASHKYCPCDSGYVDVGISVCTLCSQMIPGCSTCNSVSACATCQSGYTLTAFGTCQCNVGFMVTGVCTTIVGCISAFDFMGNVQCTLCNSSLNFILTNVSTCSCLSGYTLNGSSCTYVCGDGVLANGQTCDDRNTVSGDGCSSTCQVQSNWYCSNTAMPSVCTRIANTTFTIRYIRRITTSNTMQIAYELYPIYTQYYFSKFTPFITHNLSASSFSASYANGYVTMQFEYNKSLEAQMFSINFTLDPRYFYNSTISTSFVAKGMNAKLSYDQYTSHNYPLQVMVYILDALCMVVLIGSLFSQRFIGVEMIQTIQSVFFLLSFLNSSPSALSPLQQLRYSNGYNFISGNDYSRVYPYTFNISQLSIEKQFLLSFNFMYILLFTTVVVVLVLKYVPSLYTVYTWIFQRVLFLLGMMCLFSVCFGVAVQLTDMLPLYYLIPRQINLLFTIIAVIIESFLLATILVNGIYSEKGIYEWGFQQKYYPIYYITYQTIFILLISFVFTQTFMMYAILCMILLHILAIIKTKPYKQFIHHFTLILHQIVIALALITYLFHQLTLTNDNQYQILFLSMCYAIILLLYIVVLLDAYRLWAMANHLPPLDYQTLNTKRNNQSLQKKQKLYHQPIQLSNFKKSHLTQDFDWTYNKLADGTLINQANVLDDHAMPVVSKSNTKQQHTLQKQSNILNSNQKKDQSSTNKDNNLHKIPNNTQIKQEVNHNNHQKQDLSKNYQYNKSEQPIKSEEDNQEGDDELRKIKRRLKKQLANKILLNSQITQ